MKKIIKLLILVKHIEGGTGTFVSQLLKLKKLDKNLAIEILILGKQKYRLFHNKKTRIRYFNGIDAYPEYYQLDLTTILLVLKELLWLRKVIQSIQPDIVLSIDTHCNLLASVVKYYFFRNMRIIISTHNNISAVTEKKLSSFLCLLLKKVGGFFFKKADYIVCVSKGVTRDFKLFFSLNKRMVIIPYGIDMKQTISLSNKRLSKSDKTLFEDKYKKIVSIGRFEVQKDFDTLIQAFALVYQKNPLAHLYLIGDGYDKQRLMGLTKQLNINNVVYFLGWKQNIYPYLKHSDLFVLSSEYEGFGWVLLEAMSQGLPII